MLLFNVFSSD
ncbi:unnamed protein product, partial [Rotaria magnacalcarata]